MSAYDYPGNVRELRNLVERLAILCEGPVVSRTDALELLPRGRPLPPMPEPTAGGDAPVAPPVAVTAPPAAEPAATANAGGWRPRVDQTFREQVEDAEREIIQRVLAHTHDNVTEAARILDLERGHFYKKMKALGLRRGQSDS